MNELYLKLLNKAISDHPETSASLLIPHVKTLQEEREHLLIQILQQPLTFNSITELIHALKKENIPLNQREELIKFILSRPVSNEILQEIIEVYYSGSLSEEQRENFFSGMLSRLQSEEILRIPELLNIYPMTQEQKERFAQLAFNQVNQTDKINLGKLIQSIPLTMEQRLELISALLSDNPRDDFASVSHEHQNYLKEIHRDKLWGILMNYSPDRERRKQIFDYLLEYPVEREQRKGLWQKLLEISPENERRQWLLNILEKCKLEKEQRESLWQKLLEISHDNEHRQRILDLLDKCSLEKEHQDKLWNVLLGYPPERERRKQMVDVLIQYPFEKEQRESLWQKLLETSPESEKRQRLLSILEECKLGKEQRESLWQKLLEISHDNEHRQRILDLLDKCSLEREHQDKLWTVLLSYPPEREHRKQMVDILIQYPLEKEEREKLWDTLVEYPTNPEQVFRFSKQLFTYISKGTLPTELQTLQKIAEYRRLYKQLYPWVNPETDRWKAGQASAYERIVEQNESISDVLLDMICEENICYLKGAEMEFIDRKQLWIMIEELLLQESYAFPIDNDSPYLIDCGVNIGLAIYYMKQRWPNAQIIGFEPWDKAYECAIRNIERNQWENVEIHHTALSSTNGSQELTVIQENSTAATLTHRMDKLLSKEVFTSTNQQVQTETLSHYLTKPVDLLKMDIEGMEGLVLEEAKNQLANVRYLFCEYHYSEESKKENSLAAILSLLENKGFTYQTNYSLSYQLLRTQPGMYLGRNSSSCIWAYNQAKAEIKDERKE